MAQVQKKNKRTETKIHMNNKEFCLFLISELSSVYQNNLVLFSVAVIKEKVKKKKIQRKKDSTTKQSFYSK